MDRIALCQITATLAPTEQQALWAIVNHGSYAKVTAALGVCRSVLAVRLRQARDNFRALWHQGDPSVPRRWGYSYPGSDSDRTMKHLRRRARTRKRRTGRDGDT